jgi:uncharacterized membrane protein
VETAEGALQAGTEAATERLVFFSDAVTAIAITLLAIDLPLPVGNDSGAFLASLRANTPAYLSFLISFAVIGVHWRHHHRVFQHVQGLSGRLVLLDFCWLLMIVITPFMTRLIGRDDLSLIRFGMYAGTQTLQTAVFALIGWTLTRQGLFRAGTPARFGLVSARDAAITSAAFAVSIPVYALVHGWAFLCWPAIPFLASRLLGRASDVDHFMGRGQPG